MYNNATYYVNHSGVRTAILCDIDGISSSVPIDPNNSDYRKIMELIDAGELTIADPD